MSEKFSGQLFLAAIIGIGGIGVSFIQDMAKNIQAMTISVQELNAKMGQIQSIATDHENRIRSLEKRKY